MAINNNEIKAVVFDAYGTLFNIASIDYLLEQLFDDQALQVAAYWRRKQLEYTWLRSLMERYVDFYTLTRHALDYALGAAGIEASEESIAELMRQYYHLDTFAEVIPTLSQLKGRYRLAILSNANPSLLEKAAAHNGLDELLDDIISADQVQTYKPSPSVYELAERHTGFDRAQLLFVSSNTWDIAGASSFGLPAAWVRRRHNVGEQLGYSPALAVDNLSGLLPLLLPEEPEG